MEWKTLAEGGPRIKFKAVRKGAVSEFLPDSTAAIEFTAAATELAGALTALTKGGATPVLPDGKLAGNGSMRIACGSLDYLVVSKSGKTAEEIINPGEDSCIVTRFTPEKWEAEYYSDSDVVLPTSDTPLHYCILNAYRQFGWSEIPMVALHGHALDSMDDARHLHVPCSPEETLFSTPADLHALMDLVGHHSYPKNKIFIRQGHGFFILGKDICDAMNTFKSIIEPYLMAAKAYH